MKPEIKQLIEELASKGFNRCSAISKFSKYFEFLEMSSEERAFFDLRFPQFYSGGNISRFSKNEQTTAIQEVLAARWAGKYLVYSDPVGNPSYLRREKSENTVSEISLDELQRQVANAVASTPLDCKANEAREHAIGWADRVEPLKVMPPSFAWKSFPGLTFNRFDFEVSDVPTPLFDDFLSRIETNRCAFMAFIWSLFVPEDRGHQYLWIYGEGQDGKGSMVRLLSRLLQNAFVALDAKDKYWLASCVGKRLGAFNDMVDTTFPMRSQFKQVTGQDPVNIEQKYKKSYSTVLDTKFIFTTNKELNISTQTSDLRRCIYVKMSKNSQSSRRDYEQELWAERAGILHKCKVEYERMIHENDGIVVDQEAAKEVGEQAELKFKIWFDKMFRADESSWVVREALRNHLRDERDLLISNQDFGEFKQWMKRTHGIFERKIVDENRTLKVYQGIALVMQVQGSVETAIKRNVK